MNCTWASAIVVVAAAVAPRSLAGQGRREAGVQAIVTSADPAAVLGGVYGAYRVGRRVRVAATAGLGVAGEGTAWRLEALGHFHFQPETRGGVGLYGGGGLALAGGPSTRGYLVVLVGLEANPGGPRGWSVELGAGGGLRLGIGYRWRSAGSRNAR